MEIVFNLYQDGFDLCAFLSIEKLFFVSRLRENVINFLVCKSIYLWNLTYSPARPPPRSISSSLCIICNYNLIFQRYFPSRRFPPSWSYATTQFRRRRTITNQSHPQFRASETMPARCRPCGSQHRSGPEFRCAGAEFPRGAAWVRSRPRPRPWPAPGRSTREGPMVATAKVARSGMTAGTRPRPASPAATKATTPKRHSR